MAVQDRLSSVGKAGMEQLRALRTLGQMGLLHPRVATASGRATKAWGPNSAAGYEAVAKHSPHREAIIDDEGTLSYAEMDSLANALANALLERAIGPNDSVALLARNSRWFVLAATAIARTGAATIYLNTAFSGPQASEVMKREGARLLIADADLLEDVRSHTGDLPVLVADTSVDGADCVPDLIALAARRRPVPPGAPGAQVILTSGTTGTPKGAKRPHPKGLVTVTGLFQRVPFGTDDVHLVAAPMFHALGHGSMLISSQLGHTLVCQRRFEPEAVLAAIDAHRVTTMTAVPVMLQRILELSTDVTDRYDTGTLRIVYCSGSALPGSLAQRWMDRFGDNLYNMFASTEVGAATVADPSDLRAAPGTAGRPVPGVAVRLFDDHDQPITEPGQVGRIFVGSGLRFEGYTSGDTKDSIDGLLSIGDVGHFDDEGRLFVGGRDDDMIVSGGENVYPREVEDLLADHPEVLEVAVVGVDDDEFGQRLAAFLVLAEGASLDEDAVRRHVKEHLASYKVPRHVTFLDALPRNATGKVLTRELIT